MDDRCVCGDYASDHEPPGLFGTWPGPCMAVHGVLWSQPCPCQGFQPYHLASR